MTHMRTPPDITELKHTDERTPASLSEARELALWLGRFPEKNPSPVIRVLFDGTVLYCNPVAAKLPGWACEVGGPLPDPLLALVRQTVEGGREKRPDMDLAGRFFSISVIPFKVEGYANIYGVDVTERRRAELARSRYLEQQKQLNRLQQTLLGPGELPKKMKMITDGIVDIFAADF